MSVRWLANVARQLLSANQPLLISKFAREGEEHQHAAKRFSPGKKKMNRVKCELCDAPPEGNTTGPRAHKVRFLFSCFFCIPAVFYLLFAGRKRRELKVCARDGKVSVSYKKCRMKR